MCDLRSLFYRLVISKSVKLRKDKRKDGSTIRYASSFAKNCDTLVSYAFFVMLPQATKNVNKTFQNVLFWLEKKRFVLMYLKRSFNVFAKTKPSKNMFISSFQINVFVQCF